MSRDAHKYVCCPDLQQPVKQDDADELVLCVPLADDEWQRDSGRQLIAAVRLRQTRLPGGRWKRDVPLVVPKNK